MADGPARRGQAGRAGTPARTRRPGSGHARGDRVRGRGAGAADQRPARRRHRPAGARSLGIDRAARRGGHGLRRDRAGARAPRARASCRTASSAAAGAAPPTCSRACGPATCWPIRWSCSGKVPEVLAQLAVTTGGQAQRVKRLADLPTRAAPHRVGPAPSVPARVPAAAPDRRPGSTGASRCGWRGRSIMYARARAIWLAESARYRSSRRLTVEMPSLHGRISPGHRAARAAVSGSPDHARVAASARVLTE